MGYLLFAGILGLILGVLLVVFPEVLTKINNYCDKVLVYFDEKLLSVRLITGIIASLAGIWMIYATPVNTLGQLWGLPLAGLLVLLAGILFIIFPKFLLRLSGWCNSVLLATDTIIIKTRLSIGIILILASVYIILVAVWA